MATPHAEQQLLPTLEAILYLVHHVVLPPKLPQKYDYDVAHERTLLQVIVEALRDLQRAVKPEYVQHVTFAIATVSNIDSCRNENGDLGETQLCSVLNKISMDTSHGAIPLELKAQNAGVLITGTSESYIFDFFELSPMNEAIMSTQGRLTRTFPGSSVEMAPEKFRNNDLKASLSRTISAMATQAVFQCQPQIEKNHESHVELRDAADPRIVTDLLMNNITAMGKSVSLIGITKHTRQEILWISGELAWIRSPLWLLARVSLQLIFSRTCSKLESPDELYKAFMVLLTSRILEMARGHEQDLDHEVLHTIRAKLVRRLHKIETQHRNQDTEEELEEIRPQVNGMKSTWSSAILVNLRETYALMKTSWEDVIANANPEIDPTVLSHMRPTDHLDLCLGDVDTFIVRMLARQQNAHMADFIPVAEYPTLPASDLPINLDYTIDEGLRFRLLALENWVDNCLEDWIEWGARKKQTCAHLASLIGQYYSTASEVYEGIPERMSVMYLTILDLWVACDKSACSISPLLRKYDPEIRLTEFQCLSLPLRRQLHRLSVIEEYVHQRRDESDQDTPPIFTKFGHESSFAVQYYHKCSTMKKLKEIIEQNATAERQTKREELAAKRLEYDDLMQRYAEGHCDLQDLEQSGADIGHCPSADSQGDLVSQHRQDCGRCVLKKRVEDLTIDVHEWPLSAHPARANATIFELRIPEHFSAWRDATMHVMIYVLGFKSDVERKIEEQYSLQNHDGLKQYLPSNYKIPRLIPMSWVKPVGGTHCKVKKSIHLITETEVFYDNALKYFYYDRIRETSMRRLEASDEVMRSCTYSMPRRSKALERYLIRSPPSPDGVPPNEVIAHICDNPPHLSADEFKAYGTVPFGRNILYLSILEQLAMPTLDFAKAETQTLMFQIVNQTGPEANGLVERNNHQHFADANFCTAVLSKLQDGLYRTCSSWDSWRALSSFTLLARRLVNLTPDSGIRLQGLDMLMQVRKICIRWLSCLREKLHESTDKGQISDLQSRTAEIALLCHSTFDVEEHILDYVLAQESAVAALLQCSLISHAYYPLISNVECMHRSMIESWKALAFRILPKLQECISADRKELDKAIVDCWNCFNPSEDQPWCVQPKPHQNWLHTKSGEYKVYFNLLTSQLLINGLPLTRLPNAYSSHEVCRTLFRDSEVDVRPSNEPGMMFASVHQHHGYDVHFGILGKNVLLVAKNESCKLDLLPASLFSDRIPYAFATGYHHWYDHGTGEVIMRPHESAWPCDAGTPEWRLQRKGGFWRLVKGSITLVDTKSAYARKVAQLFSALENSPYIHVTYNSTTAAIQISLPRLRLEFDTDVTGSQINSRQYRGFVLDCNQDAGTLIRLSSKLVLRSELSEKDRMVLIPEGCVQYSSNKEAKHHTVTVNEGTAKKVHAYPLDLTLHRVLVTGDLQASLFLAYLHALTSYCLSDPLTQRTGTESALEILRSAAVSSFEKLTVQNMDLLDSIASLCPRRSFWPQGVVGVQKIIWRAELPFMSQDDQLLEIVNTIYERALKTKIFYHAQGFCEQKKESKAWMHNTEQIILSARDGIRTSTFRVSDYGAEKFTTAEDEVYEARDQLSGSLQGLRAFTAAATIFREEVALPISIRMLEAKLLGAYFCEAGLVQGATGKLDATCLRYNTQCLEQPVEVLSSIWLDMHQNLSQNSPLINPFELSIWLSTLAYAPGAEMEVIQTLGAFYKIPALAAVRLPSASAFHIYQDDRVKGQKKVRLRQIANQAKKKLEDCPEFHLPRQNGETDKQFKQRRRLLRQERSQRAVDAFVDLSLRQWMCSQIEVRETTTLHTYLDMPAATQAVTTLYAQLRQNQEFKAYLSRVSDVLSQQRVQPMKRPTASVPSPGSKSSVEASARYVRMEVFCENPPKSLRMAQKLSPDEPSRHGTATSGKVNATDLEKNLDKLGTKIRTIAKADFEHKYVDEFQASSSALNGLGTTAHPSNNAIGPRFRKALKAYLQECEDFVLSLQSELMQAVVGTAETCAEVAFCTEMSPRISPMFWLGHLNPDHFENLEPGWQEVIKDYGLAVVQLQRSQRLHGLLSKPAELAEELEHKGHSNWSPTSHPGTLLIEAESGIVIREEQEEVAHDMRRPSNDANSVVLLSMGKGKSSVIVPIVAAALADKSRLVRVITPKAQSKQMGQMLIARLGGLLNRRIYYMPITRRSRLSLADANSIRNLCEECMANRGIMLIQPEDILSFINLGLEACVTDREELAKSLMGTQAFFNKHSRDIVDECDDIFSPKFQLDYTMGSPHLIQGGLDRWELAQGMLNLISCLASQVKVELPSSIEIRHGSSGTFPRIRILRDDAVTRLHDLVKETIMEHGLAGIPIDSQLPTMRAAISRYITEPDLAEDDLQQVNALCWTQIKKELLLVARGLIAHRLLAAALSKRWRVDYGLDLSRVTGTRTAVPFRSKDTPSPRAEFAHPEMRILYTLLTYYYSGLTDDQLSDAFTHLLKSDQADIQYSEWVSTASSGLRPEYRQLAAISLKDSVTCRTQIFPALRQSSGAIHYYLANLVFPRELKVYPQKLSASGWNIAAAKRHPTTGFSGTNDTSSLLPLSMIQNNRPTQLHTRVQVLGFLLRSETLIESLPTRVCSTMTDAEHLLKVVTSSTDAPIHAILDVGAQVLDLNNREFAWLWLEKYSLEEMSAVVYFEGKELHVMDRTGFEETLQSSPFARQLNHCLIYLDEAHTRGTDLKLPRYYRAAVTLGPHLTKDRLVQACMRLRKLGHGQTITFVTTEDVAAKIRETNYKSSNSTIDVSEILCWSIRNTWDDILSSIGLWAVQGKRHETRKHLFNGTETTKEQACGFLETENQSLEARYRPRLKHEVLQEWDVAIQSIADILARLQRHGVKRLDDVGMNEEQERELNVESQQERQVQRLPRMQAKTHKLRVDLKKLARFGQVMSCSEAYKPALQALQATSAVNMFDLTQFPTNLLVSTDFMDTVKKPVGQAEALFVADTFLRQVQYVISVPHTSGQIQNLVIISPFEANKLLADVRCHSKVTLHLYAPCQNVSYEPLDKLELFNVGHEFSVDALPYDLRLQLNLFAGALYLGSYAEYTELCDALGLSKTQIAADQQVSPDGFITSQVGKWHLKESPVPFFQQLLLKIRKEGEGVKRTHLGRILSGLRLNEHDFYRNGVNGEPLRGITPQVAAAFEQHTQARRSRSPQQN